MLDISNMMRHSTNDMGSAPHAVAETARWDNVRNVYMLFCFTGNSSTPEAALLDSPSLAIAPSAALIKLASP